MQHALLLFDIDGTLVNTHGSGGSAWRAASRRLFGEAFDFNGVNFAGRLDSAIYADLAVHNGVRDHADHLPAFWEAYLRELPRNLADKAGLIEACPGVLDLLATLRRDHASDAALGLLTGNFGGAVPHKLGAVGIDPGWFAVNAFGHEADTRPQLTQLCLERYARAHGRAADPSRVIVIGDTPHDIDCAHAHGCHAFAVATGSFTAEELRAAGADTVVADLRDPSPLLQLI